MGSTNGKYSVEYGNSVQNRNKTLPSSPSNSNISKKEKRSLPTIIRRNLLIDSLLPNKDNLTLVWLDTDINNQASNIDIQIKLKNLINYLRIFDEINSFERYIEQISQMNKEQLFVIISTALSLTIIPYLHNFSQIKYIYIYGKEKLDIKINQQLIIKYPKVKNIFLEKYFSYLTIILDKRNFFRMSMFTFSNK